MSTLHIILLSVGIPLILILAILPTALLVGKTNSLLEEIPTGTRERFGLSERQSKLPVSDWGLFIGSMLLVFVPASYSKFLWPAFLAIAVGYGSVKTLRLYRLSKGGKELPASVVKFAQTAFIASLAASLLGVAMLIFLTLSSLT